MVDLVALDKAEINLFTAIYLASDVLSMLTDSEYRDNLSAAAATTLRPVIENMIRFEATGTY